MIGIGIGINKNTSNNVPNIGNVAQLWSGQILGNELICSIGPNFDIINKDFDSNWTFGIPWKSSALIAQKASSYGIVPDVNNFWFQGDGTPNQIPVISFFQNIDYANQIFSKHYSQSINPDNFVETYEGRVVVICTYSSPQTGNNLTVCNRYFSVPVKPTSNIREVGTGKTYSTFLAAKNAATSGDTILIYSGNYTETAYLPISSKNLTFKALGNVTLTTSGGGMGILLTNSVCTFERIYFKIGQAYFIDGGVSNGVTISKCRIDSVTNLLDSKNSRNWLANLTVNDSIIGTNSSTSLITAGYQEVTISNSLLINVRNYVDNGMTILNNKMIHNYTTSLVYMFQPSNGNCTTRGNKISVNYGIVNIAPAALFPQELTFDVKYNSILTIDRVATTDYMLFTSSNVGNVKYKWDVYNNIVTSSLTDKGGYIFSINQQNFDVENNIFITNSTGLKAINHFNAPANNTIKTVSGKFKNNFCDSDAINGQIIYIGVDFAAYTDMYNGTEISGNYIRGGFGNHPTESGLIHGMFIGGGKNYKIFNNWIEDCEVGIVVKNINQNFDSGGIYSNILKNNTMGIWVGGAEDMVISNNTAYINNTYTQSFTQAFTIATYTITGTTYYPSNCLFRNNIVYSTGNTGGLFHIYDSQCLTNGCSFENGQLYGGQYLASIESGAGYSTLATAQAAGILLNCLNVNPNFTSVTQLWPITPITSVATDLGSPYNVGIDTTTNWGDSTHIPTIFTKNQGTPWQIGAFIQ